MTALAVDLGQKLTAVEWDALLAKMTRAVTDKEAGPVLRELRQTARYLHSARRNVLGTGKAAKSSSEMQRGPDVIEWPMPELTAVEHQALAVHMDAAQRETRDAGALDMTPLLDLIQLAHITRLA